MRFDDRLTTVLAQPAGDPHDRAVRWRQLVDLVARAGTSQSALVDTALDVIADESPQIDESLRSAASRSISALAPPLRLIQLFAADSVQVAAPLLAAARLSPPELQRVFDAASPDNRRFLLALHPQLGRDALPPAADAAAQERREVDIPSISDVVARIERLRQVRESGTQQSGYAEPPDPAESDEPALFRWECGASGEIGWVDGAPRGALIGRSLAQSSGEDGIDPAIPQAFARRAPFHEAVLTLAGETAFAGDWLISGAPAFEPTDGRFAGYRGIAMRAGGGQGDLDPAAGEGQSDHDSIRELVHELKTPLNAIIGFAEIIDGQYFGPANDRYRARAAEIVAQARLLVAAIDDLDLAARLQSGREPATEPVEVWQLFRHLAPELQERAAERGAILDLDAREEDAQCAIHPGIAEQLVRRFCEAAIDLCAPGERMVMKLQMLRDRCAVFVALPRALRGHDADELMAGAPARSNDEEPDPFFWLRLVRGLARLTGGELMTADGNLSLILPKADSPD